MASNVFKDWINAQLKGNCDKTATVADCSETDIAFTSQVKITIKTESKTQRVDSNDSGPSISETESQALSQASPMEAVQSALVRNPINYLLSPGRNAVPGWIFSETNLYPCQTCNQSGQVNCNTCSGRGKVACRFCGGSGQIPCTACGAKGYVTKTVQRRDNAGYYHTVQERKRCLCVAGRVTCHACSGAGRTNCHTCNGHGKTSCQNCRGKGQIFERTTKTYFAEHTTSTRLNAMMSPIVDFASKRWHDLVRANCQRISTTTQRGYNSHFGEWEFQGSLNIESQTIVIGKQQVSLTGASAPAGGIESAVFDLEPFLGEVLGLKKWKTTKKSSRQLLSLSSTRIVRECITAWNAASPKKEERAAAVDSFLKQNYGPALSEDDRRIITDTISVGMKQLRSERLSRFWQRFSILTVGVVAAIIVAVVVLNGTLPPDHPATGKLSAWGLLVACGIWFIGGWFTARFTVASLNKKLGVETKLSSEQGVWNGLGVLLNVLALNAGTALGLAIALGLIAHTQYLDPFMRREILGDPAANRFLPTTKTLLLASETPLFSRPDDRARPFNTLPGGTPVGILAVPVEGWTPVRIDGEFGWIKTP